MKERILGIDTGTNSLGWAIVEKSEEGCQLLEKGTNIFAEGVKK
jgi:CRISPR-associated endonuclease Csn1